MVLHCVAVVWIASGVLHLSVAVRRYVAADYCAAMTDLNASGCCFVQAGYFRFE